MPKIKKEYKCGKCGIVENIGTIQMVPYNGHYYHQHCFDLVMQNTINTKLKKTSSGSSPKNQKKKSKPKSVSSDVIKKQQEQENTKIEISATDQESEDKKLFETYMQTLTGKEARVSHRAVAKRYVEQYELTYAEIVMAIRYFIEVEGGVYNDKKNIVAIVPYTVDKAREYYKAIDEAAEYNKNINIEEFYRNTTRLTYVSPSKTKKQIDISEIVWD